jgi:hypothetical protein
LGHLLQFIGVHSGYTSMQSLNTHMHPPTCKQASRSILSARSHCCIQKRANPSFTHPLTRTPHIPSPPIHQSHLDLPQGEALGRLRMLGYEAVERGFALLGYAAAGGSAAVLLATKLKTKCNLPGGHVIYSVTDSQWVMLPLSPSGATDPNPSPSASGSHGQGGGGDPRQDADFWRTVQQYTLNNAHYFCETADITRPFPSHHPVSEPEPEFVWNAWLSEPLRELGLHSHCPVLLQVREGLICRSFVLRFSQGRRQLVPW